MHRLPLGLVASLGYFAALAAIALWPTRVDAPVDAEVARLIEWLGAHGVPPALASYAGIEFAANIALFLPCGVILAWCVTRRSWWVAPLAAAALTGGIELLQGLLLPARVSDPRDLLANGAGALLGMLAVLVVRLLRPTLRRVPVRA